MSDTTNRSASDRVSYQFSGGDSETAVSDCSASTAVVELVADVTNRDRLELNPLHYTIDGDALDAVVDSLSGAGDSISFDYEGCAVTVFGDDTVTATRLRE